MIDLQADRTTKFDDWLFRWEHRIFRRSGCDILALNKGRHVLLWPNTYHTWRIMRVVFAGRPRYRGGYLIPLIELTSLYGPRFEACFRIVSCVSYRPRFK